MQPSETPVTATTAGRKPVIGLTGGIGAGKSAAAKILGDFGALVIESDAVNRELLRTGDVANTLRSWWGESVLSEDGSVNRKRVADIVFADAAQRERLEHYLHPLIDADRQRRTAAAQSDPAIRAIVIDAPLLYEAGIDNDCDAVIFVHADRAIRDERVRASRGWSPDELDRREKMQMDLALKSARADYTCNNNSGRDSLREQLSSIFYRIVGCRR